VKDSSTELLRLLEKSGGELPIGDKSTPEEVSRLTGMSKKVFKRALGVLLKQGVVAATDNEIKKTVE
jgi:predicted RNA-binding protein (virulence factor B family)